MHFLQTESVASTLCALWDLSPMVGRRVRNGQNFHILDENSPWLWKLQFNEGAFPFQEE